MSNAAPVKRRFPRWRTLLASALSATICLTTAIPARAAEQGQDALAILHSIRIAQTSQHQSLHGQLNHAGKSVPFHLFIEGPVIRYQFDNPPQNFQLRLLEKGSRLEELTPDHKVKPTAARFDDPVAGTDLCLEDLAMRFLYWPKATIEGEKVMILRPCWVIRAEPGSKSDSQYARVTLWVDKENGALMQAEAFNHSDQIVKRFKVISGQKIDGVWVLKKMRIESPGGSRQDRTPTYLEINSVGK